MKYSLSAIALALSTNLFAAAPICVNPSVSDPDGDGWGWENSDSCRVGSSPVVIDNGDVLQACLAEGSSLEAEVARLNQRIAALEGGSSDGGQATCVDTDPQGDGWGWDGSTSCRVGGAIVPAVPDYTNQNVSCEAAAQRIETSVDVGLTESQVRALVGKPTRIVGSDAFRYFQFTSNNSVSFENGRVISFYTFPSLCGS